MNDGGPATDPWRGADPKSGPTLPIAHPFATQVRTRSEQPWRKLAVREHSRPALACGGEQPAAENSGILGLFTADPRSERLSVQGTLAEGSQNRYGIVRWRPALVIGLLSAGGVAGGVALATWLSEGVLERLFACLLLVVAARLAWSARR